MKSRAGLGSQAEVQSSGRFVKAKNRVVEERVPPALTDGGPGWPVAVKPEVVDAESLSDSGRKQDSLEDRIVARNLERKRSGSEEEEEERKEKGKREFRPSGEKRRKSLAL